MTLLDAMNWRGPPFGTGFSDNEPWTCSDGMGKFVFRVGFCVLGLRVGEFTLNNWVSLLLSANDIWLRG